MLGTPKEAIEKALTVRVVAAKGEVMEVKANLSKAIYARDALAKVNINHFEMKAKNFIKLLPIMKCSIGNL